jgi:hypothetical protein
MKLVIITISFMQQPTQLQLQLWLKHRGLRLRRELLQQTATAKTVSVTGLTASTAYKAYLIVKDAAGNASAVSTITLTTTAATSGGGSSGGSSSNSSSSGTSAAEAAAIRAANEAAAKVEAEKAAAAKAAADAKAALDAAAKAAADKAALEKAAAERAAADKVEAERNAAAAAVVKAEEERLAALEVKAAATNVKAAVGKSGLKLTLDLPDKYVGKIVTIYVGTTKNGKTTFKKLDFFALDKEDGTATISSKVKLAKGQIIRVNVGKTVVQSVRVR